jgi:hypothetical protein
MSDDLHARIASLERRNRLWKWVAVCSVGLLLVVCPMSVYPLYLRNRAMERELEEVAHFARQESRKQVEYRHQLDQLEDWIRSLEKAAGVKKGDGPAAKQGERPEKP